MRLNISHRMIPAAVVLSLLAGSATAGPLSTDPAAMAGWKGSVLFANTVFASTLKADVEYAVYAPGQFSTSAALTLPVDPSGGTDFVYAYEIFNRNTGPSPSTISVKGLTVGLNPGANPSGIYHTILTPEAGAPPNLSQLIGAPPQSAKWTYEVSPYIALGNHSDILFFTSPHGPQFLTASIVASVPDSDLLPSPVPEPTTALLAAAAVFCLLATRLVRRFRV